MRVWQPGSSLVQHRKVQVDDWSWAATKRRLTALYRLARPYRLRTAVAIGALLVATAMALIPPLLIGAAVQEIQKKSTASLGLLVAAFVAVSLEPAFASLDDYVPQVERAVQAVHDRFQEFAQARVDG